MSYYQDYNKDDNSRMDENQLTPEQLEEERRAKVPIEYKRAYAKFFLKYFQWFLASFVVLVLWAFSTSAPVKGGWLSLSLVSLMAGLLLRFALMTRHELVYGVYDGFDHKEVTKRSIRYAVYGVLASVPFILYEVIMNDASFCFEGFAQSTLWCFFFAVGL